MHVITLPASAGVAWLKEALRLFRRQPFAFTALVILYSMALMLVASMPIIGLPMASVLVPFGTLSLTMAGRDAERNQMPMPSLLIEPFRRPLERAALLRLGLAQAMMVITLVMVSSLLAADEIRNWTLVDGQPDPASVAANIPVDALLVAGLIYVPILMLTWFAPMLVTWHRMPLGKALFFSFFACWRNRWPFTVLGLLLAAMLLGGGLLAGELLRMLSLSAQATSLLFAPIGLALTAVVYSTLYPVYRSVIVSDAVTPAVVLPPPAPGS